MSRRAAIRPGSCASSTSGRSSSPTGRATGSPTALRNILENPHVGLLFLIPGIGDSFRVNGRASIIDDPVLLAASVVDGKAPKLGILVEIEEAYTQCSKALIRSDLWNPELHVDRKQLPSSGEILRAVREDDFDADRYDSERAERYARGDGLY